jgi:hypothetical protein
LKAAQASNAAIDTVGVIDPLDREADPGDPSQLHAWVRLVERCTRRQIQADPGDGNRHHSTIAELAMAIASAGRRKGMMVMDRTRTDRILRWIERVLVHAERIVETSAAPDTSTRQLEDGVP